jgi:hypothetical protein
VPVSEAYRNLLKKPALLVFAMRMKVGSSAHDKCLYRLLVCAKSITLVYHGMYKYVGLYEMHAKVYLFCLQISS